MAPGVTTIRTVILLVFGCSVAFLTGSFFHQGALDTVALDRDAGADPFAQLILDRLENCATNSNIPARDDVLEMIDALRSDGVYLERGNRDLKGKFLTLHRLMGLALNHALNRNEIIHPLAISHAPSPPSTLCVQPTTDHSFRCSDDEPQGLCLYKTQAQIIQEYLLQGGNLYVVYPKEGLEKRPLEQQQAYQASRDQYDSLVDWELSTSDFDPEMIGSTYLFQNNSGCSYCLSIKVRQPRENRDDAEWGIWFGNLTSNATVAERLDIVCHYLNDGGCAPLDVRNVAADYRVGIDGGGYSSHHDSSHHHSPMQCTRHPSHR